MVRPTWQISAHEETPDLLKCNIDTTIVLNIFPQNYLQNKIKINLNLKFRLYFKSELTVMVSHDEYLFFTKNIIPIFMYFFRGALTFSFDCFVTHYLFPLISMELYVSSDNFSISILFTNY